MVSVSVAGGGILGVPPLFDPFLFGGKMRILAKVPSGIGLALVGALFLPARGSAQQLACSTTPSSNQCGYVIVQGLPCITRDGGVYCPVAPTYYPTPAA